MFAYLVCSFKSSHSSVVILVFRNTWKQSDREGKT